MLILIIMQAITGFVIGWFTNWLVVKFIFHPKRPWLGIKLIWGIVPSRRVELIKKIAKVASEKIATPQAIKSYLGQNEDGSLNINMLQGDDIISVFGNSIVSSIAEDIIDNQYFDIEQLILKELNSFDEDQLENVILSVVNQELKLIIWFGGLLGIVFGIISGVICSILLNI